MFKKSNFPRWLAAYVVVILAIALLINAAMLLPIPTIAALDAPTWLTFWGSYLGGAIGCIPAIAAYRHSIDDSKRRDEAEERKRRLDVRPIMLISSSPVAASDIKNYPLVIFSSSEGLLDWGTSMQDQVPILPNTCLLTIKNLGQGHALNLKLSYETPRGMFTSVELGTLEKEKAMRTVFCFSDFISSPDSDSDPGPGPDSDADSDPDTDSLAFYILNLTLTFEDVLRNEYQQKIHLSYDAVFFNFLSRPDPVLKKLGTEREEISK